jgi:eukaryotic-like serine/threonine-protein kinase
VAVPASDDRSDWAAGRRTGPELLPWGTAALTGPGGAPGPVRACPPPILPGSELAPGLWVLAHRQRGKDLEAYDCWSAAHNSRCFVRTLRPDRLESPARRRLVREARLLLSFPHPHLIRAYDFLQAGADGSPLLLVEAIVGPTLDRRLRDGRRLSLADLAQLGRQLCSAARHLHDHRYLHLDLKPSTIVADGDRVRLIDLSSARRPGRTMRGWGTPYQMSPEQVRGGQLTSATDVWGVGLVLYQAATGHHPFLAPVGCETYGRVRFLQLTTAAPRVRSLRRLPAAVGTILDACLEVRPADRPTLREVDACLTPLG